jgi:UPF0042 nucleotide-binding protein
VNTSRRPGKTARLSGAEKPSRVVIITGLSGSGKTVALRAVEDLQFFCVDNLPVSLISTLISKISGNTGNRNIAIGIDIREKEFLANIHRELSGLRKRHLIEILYLEAETDVLLRRFKETRRPHPLGGDLEEAVNAERRSLAVLKKNADRIIDTSSFSPHQLRKFIASLYPAAGVGKDMTVLLVSFGFKFGVPQNIDLLFDVRFLPNPNFVASLKQLTGVDKPVSEYVLGHRKTEQLIKKIKDFLAFVLPLYIKEGRSYLTVAVGCTGGRHRSPAIVEELSRFVDRSDIALKITHRELE